MLDPGSWESSGRGLEPGQKRRLDHDCGPGSTLIISRDERGFHAYCFRCSDSGWLPPPEESTQDRLRRIQQRQVGERPLCRPFTGLPEPQVRDLSLWPSAASLWLYASGFGRDTIGRLGIYYHPPSDRVVLPVFGRDGVPVFYQARAVQPGRSPKYMSPTPRPPDLLPRWGAGQIPTLTEDLLSAMKIGQVGYGWALLGTSASDHTLAALIRSFKEVRVWLDPDDAGQRGARKIAKTLRAYGVTVHNTVSYKDPKRHTIDEIRSFLNDEPHL